MRNQIIDFLKKELIGPDPIAPYIQSSGEEILPNEPPRLRYGAGILFPQRAGISDIGSTGEAEQEILKAPLPDETSSDPDVETAEFFSKITFDDSEANDDTLNLTNAFLPSAMGFSCFLDVPDKGFVVGISAGRYKLGDVTIAGADGNPISLRGFLRESLDTEFVVPESELPFARTRSINFEVRKNGEPTGLVINIRNRTPGGELGKLNQFYTFTLINTLQSSGNHIDNENCFFQTGFYIRAENHSACFLPYPARQNASEHNDDRSARLLYRNHKTYAIGHGCSPSWLEKEGRCVEIRTEIIPLFEMKPVLPQKFPDLQLKMYDFSDYENPDLQFSALSDLCEKYETWISQQEAVAKKELSADLQGVALSNIANCRRCLIRMHEGIELIKADDILRKAFNLMNRAMLLQQLRYGLKLREWKVKEDRSLDIEKIDYPDIHRPETWSDWSKSDQDSKKYGSWYPFQIAFILMNIKSIAFPQSNDRNIIDLIWFPTGGGKTEAYLGLTAFTIFLKRLRHQDDSGTTVLMRYTLRLLTAQQFQRAAALICACEILREENKETLGSARITAGLWVGEGLTPNKRSTAVSSFRKMTQGNSRENPFILLKCPWCGAQMGSIKDDRQHRVQGYKLSRDPSTIVFQCHNIDCAFSSDNFRLPLFVVDEDIYQNPPTLLIGTVDKFAMLTWNPEAKSFFGFRRGGSVSPPELIIQDELHLISGPLGSMVGHYETILSELCRNKSTDPPVCPKIITSTATISRAAQQCHALYSCGEENVSLFPPQCINAGESFFAFEDKEAKGRLYVGVHATGLPSHATTQVRVISALLQGTKSASVGDEKDRNFYWSVLNYFNSLRELGHAATLIRADIREYLNAMWIRKRIHKTSDTDPRRFINRAIELTSRIPNTDIPRYLQDLECDYPVFQGNYPVDICLATNMISVGVDIQRLGLMTVIGQPKTTSEYIQATSRVGRSKDGPGVVVIIYNVTKPRDRSHYEHFRSYHSAIYSQVEPTSVTPFSSPVRERALHALLVTYVRYFGTEQNRACPQPMPDDALLNKFRKLIQSRLENVDHGELALTLKLLEERIEEWERSFPPRYGGFGTSTAERPLMYPAGMTPHEEWEGVSWPTPTSMRNVDVSCEAGLIGRYREVI